MHLHEALSDLARDHGEALFRDAAAFRGALDDYLDESMASGGTINLLTDAVRLGALDSMLTMIGSGASPADAVEAAGSRLARDRGSTDVRGCQWACAMLGFALDRVPMPLVESLDPDAATAAPPQWPSSGGQPPIQSPVPAPPTPPGYAQSPAQSPAPSPAPPPQQSPPHLPYGAPAAASGGTAPYGHWSAPQAAPGGPKKSKTPLILAAVAAVLVLVIGGVIAAIALSGGEDDPKADDNTSESATEGTTEDTTDSAAAGDGPTIDGTGYTVVLPSDDWTDGTDSFLDGQAAGSLDKVALWGETTSTARANVIFEATSANGNTEPEPLVPDWKTALTAGDSTASLVDIEDREIDGNRAVGVEITRTNESGVEVYQKAYLVVSGGNAYSIALSRKAGDTEVDAVFDTLLAGVTWDE